MAKKKVSTELCADGVARTIRFAQTGLGMKITKVHEQRAVKGDCRSCVVAQSLLDALGELFEFVEVGPSVTKIVTKTEVIKYNTPEKLKRAIPVFDETGFWHLPIGDYRLLPYSRHNEKRHKLIKGTGGRGKNKLVVFSGSERSIPRGTRKMTRLDILCGLQEQKSKKKPVEEN